MNKYLRLLLFIFISIMFYILMTGKLIYNLDFNNFKNYLKLLLSLLFGYVLIYRLFKFKK